VLIVSDVTNTGTTNRATNTGRLDLNTVEKSIKLGIGGKFPESPGKDQQSSSRNNDDLNLLDNLNLKLKVK